MQDDLMFAHLTVFETLSLAAHFYCPITDTDEQKEKLVNGILAALGLYKARNTIIGDQKYRGVSGGERKRVNIATQIITDPAALFLDEPTSGLDAFQALAVMECIKSLADHGRMIVTVIHQPRSSIFALFDQLLLLSDGNDIFFGNADAAVDFFNRSGFPCPKSFNPADHFLDVLSRDTRSDESIEESTERLIKIRKLATNSVNASAALGKKEGGGGEQKVYSEVKAIGSNQELSVTDTLMRVKLLGWRSWKEITGDYKVIVGTYVISTILALVIGGIYSQLGNDQISIQDRSGLLFFMGVNMGFSGLFSVLNSFPKEKVVVGRERTAGAYGFIAYFGSKFVVELPIKVFPSIIYSNIVYWIVGLNPTQFGQFQGIMLVQIITTVLLGYAISATMPTIEASNAFGPLCMIIAILFGGFYITIDALPVVADLIPWISFQRWFFQAVTINEYTGLKFTCDTVGYACKTTGEEVLEALSFDGHKTSYGVFGLSMCLLGFLAYTLLIMLNTKETFINLGFVGYEYTKLESAGELLPDKERGDLFMEQPAKEGKKDTGVVAAEVEEDEEGGIQLA
jgi:ABC-type multidrug transport system ATPase subunit/ABC-type multidrug transport system permease subunit